MRSFEAQEAYNDVLRASLPHQKRCDDTYDALVLDARLRQALVTVRSLGRHGLSICALETLDVDRHVPAFSSRWCERGFVCPDREGSEAYLVCLEQLLACSHARVLIPASDGTIALIRQHRQRLEQHIKIAMAQEPALTIAVNKELTLATARQLGLVVPRSVFVRGREDILPALREIALPVVIKPVESWVGSAGARFASQLVTTIDEARCAVEALTHTGGTVLFQQFLTGRREAISVLYAHGKMHARFAQWAKRTEPPLGGQSVLRQSIAIPADIGEQAERLIREIELEGYSEIEFRRDVAGIPYLMEINPRLSASVEIAVRSGVNFPLLLYQWANGEPIDTVESYHIGGWMRYLTGDIMTTLEALQQRGRPGVMPPAQALLDFLLAFFMPMDYDYVDWDDPIPSLRATLDFMGAWIGGAVMKKMMLRKRKIS